MGHLFRKGPQAIDRKRVRGPADRRYLAAVIIGGTGSHRRKPSPRHDRDAKVAGTAAPVGRSYCGLGTYHSRFSLVDCSPTPDATPDSAHTFTVRHPIIGDSQHGDKPSRIGPCRHRNGAVASCPALCQLVTRWRPADPRRKFPAWRRMGRRWCFSGMGEKMRSSASQMPSSDPGPGNPPSQLPFATPTETRALTPPAVVSLSKAPCPAHPHRMEPSKGTGLDD